MNTPAPTSISHTPARPPKATPSPLRGTPPYQGESFCPPDKGGSRGGFFPIGKQDGSEKKTPSPLRGDPPYQGDNGTNTPLIRGIKGVFHEAQKPVCQNLSAIVLLGLRQMFQSWLVERLDPGRQCRFQKDWYQAQGLTVTGNKREWVG